MSTFLIFSELVAPAKASYKPIPPAFHRSAKNRQHLPIVPGIVIFHTAWASAPSTGLTFDLSKSQSPLPLLSFNSTWSETP